MEHKADWVAAILVAAVIGLAMAGGWNLLDWQKKDNDLQQLQQQVTAKAEDYVRIRDETTHLPQLVASYQQAVSQWRSFTRHHPMATPPAARFDQAFARSVARLHGIRCTPLPSNDRQSERLYEVMVAGDYPAVVAFTRAVTRLETGWVVAVESLDFQRQGLWVAGQKASTSLVLRVTALTSPPLPARH